MPPVHAELLGRAFRFRTAPGLFSADRVDDGTRLLLQHLPASSPASVLDLGCGYGALGLPVAARHPDARVTLVDRDALAVERSLANAASNAVSNVTGFPSLGYRDLGDSRFDWVLSNVPARIGDEAIAYFLGGGASRLTKHGELRIVVIQALAPVVERVASERLLPVRKIAEGDRHVVFACATIDATIDDHESFYLRDRVQILGREFERPHDINEDREHLAIGVPLLLDCLPKRVARALTWRGGYGPLPFALLQRGAEVVVTDRDLLALTYVRRNVDASVTTSISAQLSGDSSPLVVGELVANAGLEVLTEELLSSQRMLAKAGQALWLGLGRTIDQLQPTITALGATIIARRGSYAVVRVASRAARA